MDIADSSRNASGKTGAPSSGVDSDDDDSGGIRGGSPPPIPSRSRKGALHDHTRFIEARTAGRTGISPSLSPTDPLDLAIVDAVSGDADAGDFRASHANSGPHATKNEFHPLDKYVQQHLRHATAPAATMANAMAQGSLSRVPSAITSLKEVENSTRQRDHAAPTGVPSGVSPRVPAGVPVPMPLSPLPEDVAGSLTYDSSSPPSSSGSVDSLSGLDSGAATSSEAPREFLRPLSPKEDVRSKAHAEEAAIPRVNLPIKSLMKRICVAGVETKLGRGHNRQEFCLTSQEISDICVAAREVFLSQPTMLRLGTPVKVVGDLHGQFKDLMRILRMGGMPPDASYLFLGDYVDRGKQSLETIMLLLLLKLRYPENIFLLRGNHECAGVTKVYGFYDECKRRASIKSWKSIVDMFNCLPIAATIGGRIFCVHGGLSPSLKTFDDISRISRPTDVPDAGLMSDLLWSDPDPQVKEWSDNDRGVSYCFGQRTLDRFCNRFGIDLVVRGHMVVEDGYEFFGRRKLVTVFSAPNYCGDFDNWGAIMNVDKNLLCSFDVLEPMQRPTKPGFTGSRTAPKQRKQGRQAPRLKAT